LGSKHGPCCCVAMQRTMRLLLLCVLAIQANGLLAHALKWG
jgi:hypothetical protein